MTTSERIKLLESKAVLFGAAGMADLAEAYHQRAARLANDEATDVRIAQRQAGELLAAWDKIDRRSQARKIDDLLNRT